MGDLGTRYMTILIKDTLLYNLIRELERHGKTERDLAWIGTKDGRRTIPFVDFVEQAIKIRIREAREDMVFSGHYWWLEISDDGLETELEYFSHPAAIMDKWSSDEYEYHSVPNRKYPTEKLKSITKEALE
jgi:hypothetical protein